MSKFADAASPAIPIWFVTTASIAKIMPELPAEALARVAMQRFEPRAGRHLIVPGPTGEIAAVIFGIELEGARLRDPFLPGKLVTLLPSGTYCFANAPHDLDNACLAWLLASYRFTLYKAQPGTLPLLQAPEGVDASRLALIARSVFIGRDMINTPANDLGPDTLEQVISMIAASHGAVLTVIKGQDLLDQNFPLIHAVGRAAAQAPRLVEFSFGRADAPKVTLVGKGVCYDTGGLNIKPDASMFLMKKDMGGAATALTLAMMLMKAKCDICLRVILPIVENSISANAFRPGDIYPSRKGLSVEIGNTDAEGRLILADALALADAESPDLLLDFATLTGAARVALGPDLPPFYSTDDALAEDIARHARITHDPVWRMPLWEPYDASLEGRISDLNNISSGPFAGSITAALFLRRFVEKARAFVHFDLYGWTPSARPGRPEGGETQTARLLFSLLMERYGTA